MQFSQRSQPLCTSTATRSPTRNSSIPGPSAATVPAYSWPMMNWPSGWPTSFRWSTFTSVPQIDATLTFSSASPGPGSGTGQACTRMSSAPWENDRLHGGWNRQQVDSFRREHLTAFIARRRGKTTGWHRRQRDRLEGWPARLVPAPGLPRPTRDRGQSATPRAPVGWLRPRGGTRALAGQRMTAEATGTSPAPERRPARPAPQASSPLLEKGDVGKILGRAPQSLELNEPFARDHRHGVPLPLGIDTSLPCTLCRAGANLDHVQHEYLRVPWHDLGESMHHDLALGQPRGHGLSPNEPVGRERRGDRRKNGRRGQEIDIDGRPRAGVDGHRDSPADRVGHTSSAEGRHYGPKFLVEVGHASLG